jgi:thiol-disulfide isomerase/thioredoxin
MSGILTVYKVPGCGHCVALKPEWEKIKEKYGNAAHEVNCHEQGQLCTAEQIQGVPTLRFHVKGVKLDHVGERTFDAIDKAAQILGLKDFKNDFNVMDLLFKSTEREKAVRSINKS